jgi:hypothetical protein
MTLIGVACGRPPRVHEDANSEKKTEEQCLVTKKHPLPGFLTSLFRISRIPKLDISCLTGDISKSDIEAA